MVVAKIYAAPLPVAAMALRWQRESAHTAESRCFVAERCLLLRARVAI